MKNWLFLAAVNGAIAVLCGAFAAHGLKARLPADMVGVFDTGARYHLVHALALGLAALTLGGQDPHGPAAARARLAAMFFLGGIVLFSGSLYLLALTGLTAFGLLTPVGGLAFVAGWGTLAAAALKLETP
jgi:uncharacterized membrane protein YgdD (TMEM256/DUF423 family)